MSGTAFQPFPRASHMLPFFVAEEIDSFPASSSGFPSGVIELTSAWSPLQNSQHPTQEPRACQRDTLGTVCWVTSSSIAHKSVEEGKKKRPKIGVHHTGFICELLMSMLRDLGVISPEEWLWGSLSCEGRSYMLWRCLCWVYEGFHPHPCLFKKFLNFFFNVFMFFHNSQKRALDLPELQLQVALNHLT